MSKNRNIKRKMKNSIDLKGSKENISIPKKYVIDGDKIKDLEDLKVIISLLNIHFTPPSDEIYEKYKHLLSEVPEL